jgi:predicted DNA-binding transcriptional regulator AlpA
MPEHHTTGYDEELLNLDEAAVYLHASPSTLRFWRQRGTGPRSFRAGRRVKYRRSDLRAWLDGLS